ncbi:ROGDI protein, partial [Amia calva]|nr:ROGDI protein [Amia calva]
FKSSSSSSPQLMDAVMLQLTRARNRLTTPATMTLPELASSGLMKMFTPPLPGDVLVNFYINLSKLCLTVYQLHVLQPNTNKNFKPSGSSVLHNPGAMFELNNLKFEVSHVHKVECVVPWLNDTLVFFTISLQLCQQLKDKVRYGSCHYYESEMFNLTHRGRLEREQITGNRRRCSENLSISATS